ncbi:MAG: carbohydrate binding domain-containing protein [Bryobacteraceae bacterium]
MKFLKFGWAWSSSVVSGRRGEVNPTIIAAVLLICGTVTCLPAEDRKKIYPERWTYAGARFGSDQELAQLEEVARTSAQHGMTAVVLSGMDRISLANAAYLARLAKFKEFCDGLHLEIIPAGFKTGYGGSILSHDPNLAEGLAVEGALFVAGKTEARFVPDSPARLANSGFEEFKGDRANGFQEQDQPGHRSFVDRSVFHSGKASLRLENFGETAAGVARVQQEIRVTPNRCYRISAWVKTEGAEPGTLFSLKAFTADHRDLSPFEPPLAPTGGWTKVTTAFNSWYADRIFLNAGVFEGVRGKVWVDDLAIEEVGLMNVIRRDGTPLQVRDEKTGTIYKEGQDFAPVRDAKLDFQWEHEMPVIRLQAGGRIHPGARLRVDYYHGTTIYRDQVVACPSEPRVDAIWRQQFPLVEKYVAPRKYLLELDEMRAMNRCEACRRRNMGAAEMVGDVMNRVYRMVREFNPKAGVYVWSDMFDPNHNAVEQYYLVNGDLRDTVKYLPKDTGVVCWYYEKRRASLDFFSKLGFHTIGAAYYDADDLENPKGWLDALAETPGAEGIMYTTWSSKYKLLGAFGDLVSKH